MSDTELETEATDQPSDLEVEEAPAEDAAGDAVADEDAAIAAPDGAVDAATDDVEVPGDADPDGSDADAGASADAGDQAADADPGGSDADADAGDAGASHAGDQAADADAGESDLDDLLGLAGADTDADAAPADDSGAEPSEDATDEQPADGEEDAADDADDAEEPVVRRRPESIEDVQDRRDLIRLAGDWFVVHTYSGYEKKVKQNLSNRAESLAGGDRIFETVIPTEEVTEFKKGKKKVVQKKFLPGYVLVRMELDDESWNLVRHTPAVTGFVGASANKPVPLSLREVAATLSIPDRIEEVDEDEEAAAHEAARAAVTEIDLEVGETVRVTDGPFADFEGTIDEINLDQAKLRLMMNVFGRETPLEIQFDKVAKVT